MQVTNETLTYMYNIIMNKADYYSCQFLQSRTIVHEKYMHNSIDWLNAIQC